MKKIYNAKIEKKEVGRTYRFITRELQITILPSKRPRKKLKVININPSIEYSLLIPANFILNFDFFFKAPVIITM